MFYFIFRCPDLTRTWSFDSNRELVEKDLGGDEEKESLQVTKYTLLISENHGERE